MRLTSEEQNEEASYASPEELTADFLPDRLCDIFAFGTVYYELLTGVHPFLSGTSSKPKINLLNREPAPLRELVPVCPEALERLVCRALDKHRALRYQSWDEVNVMLSRFFAN